MAQLNLKYFDGNNYYSDGDIENVILDMVKGGKDYSEMTGTDNLYPVMYHLSAERENILNWYPFKKTDAVLEVGAGCGAITGLLCRKAGTVTSVELSRRRSQINYERNKDYDNLEIIVGNLNEIDLDGKYDYVILNGVFEYAMSFTEGANPYVKFLAEIKKKLKTSGKILIAIENRLGMKYFAGAMEDHTNDYFVGLDGYKGNDTVRTFSRTELEDTFEQCGISKWKFYYPYPDYKFPTEIFSDENINGSSYGKIYRNYQKHRIHLFDECKMIHTLKQEKVMESFSNSFLVELLIGDAEESNVAYAKMNATRKEEYCIATIISQNGSEYSVEKVPLKEKAAAHIAQTYQNQKKPLPAPFAYLQGEMQGESVCYPYVKGDNIDALFQKYLKEGKREEIEAIIDRIAQALFDASTKQSDIYDDRFVRYFGNVKGKENIECIKDCNIDMILDNLYLTEDKYVVIDAEWVMDGWIPTGFIIWRMLNEWYSKYDCADKLIPRNELYAKYGMKEEETGIYRSWALHFANEFVSDRDMGSYISEIQDVDIRQAVEDCGGSRMVSSLFIDYGEGFREEDKAVIETELKNGNFYLKVMLDENREIKALRWDPVEFKGCRCRVDKCKLDGEDTEIKPLNAEKEENTLFLTPDPQYQIVLKPGNYQILELSGEFEILNTAAYLEAIGRNKQHLNILMAENKVNTAENSKLTSVNGELKQKVDKLNAENEKLHQDNTLLQSEKEDLTARVTTLDKENGGLKEDNSRLYSQVGMMSDELEMIKSSRGFKILAKVWALKEKFGKEK